MKSKRDKRSSHPGSSNGDGDHRFVERSSLGRRKADRATKLGRGAEARRAALNLLEDAVLAREAEERVVADLRKNEEASARLAAIVECSDDAIISKDLNSIVRSWNRGAERIFGYTAEEMIGRSITVLFPEEYVDEEPKILARLRRGESVEHYETTRRRKDGKLIDISLTVSPIRDTSGKIIGASKIARDITERKAAEEALRQRENQLRLVTDSMPALISQIDADYRYRFANQAYYDWFGRSPFELIGKTMAEVLGDEAFRILRPHVDKALSGNPEIFETEAPYRDGGSRFIEATYLPEFGDDGAVKGIFVLVVDITERKRVEEALKKSEARARNIFETAGVSLWEEDFSRIYDAIDKLNEQGVTDLEAYFHDNPKVVQKLMGLVRVLDVNDTTVKMFEAQDKSELIGALPKIFVPASMHVFVGEMVAIATGQNYYQAEARLKTVRGNPIDVAFTMVLPLDRSQPVLFSVFDISERKRVEDVLHAKDAELQMIADTTPFVLVRNGRDLRYRFINKAGAALFNRTPEQMVGQPLLEIMGKRAFATIQPYIRAVLRGETVEFETEIPYPIGTRSVRVKYEPERNARGKVVGWLASIVDITEIRRAQDARREVEERFSRFMGNLPALAWIKDLEGRYVYANDSAVKAFGISREELYARTDDEVFPENIAAQFRMNDRRALEAGGVIDEVETLEQDDGVVHYSRVTKFPIDGPDGNVAAIGGMATDITETKQAELQREFLFDMGERIRIADDPDTLLAGVVRALGEYLGVHRCLFNEIDVGKDVETVKGDYSRTGDSIAGRHKVSDYSSVTSAVMMQGQTVINRDSKHDARTAKYFKNAYGPRKELAYIAVPMLREGRWVASLWCSDDRPRDWTSQEISLVEEVAERAWSAAERLRSEAALRESEEKFRILSDTAPALIWFDDPEGNCLYVNQNYLDFSGKTLDDLAGTGWQLVLHPDDANSYVRSFTEAQRLRTVFNARVRARRSDGAWRWLESYAQPLFAGDGTYIGHVGVSPDMTESIVAEEQLRRSQERFLLAQRAGGVGIWDWDILAGRTYWSETTWAFYGEMPSKRNPDEAFWSEHIHDEDRERVMRRLQESLDGVGDRYWDEFRIARPDGSVLWIETSATITRDQRGKPTRVYGVNLDITRRRQSEEELRRAHDELELRVAERTQELAEANAMLLGQMEEQVRAEDQRIRLLKKIVTIQEDERGRIARDLHDQLGQRLTALRLKIAALKDVNPGDKVINERVARLQEISEGVDNEVSYLAWELRPSILEEAGLVAALEQHVKEWSRHCNIAGEFSSFGLRDHVISPDLETNLYRIAQEALNNAAKHSRATRANVLLERRGDELILIVEDDGSGFDPAAIQMTDRTGRGFGLSSMHDRANVIGGTLEIESKPGHGTTIFVRVSVI